MGRNDVEQLEGRTLLSSWYVSAGSGSDLNQGTLGQPFQTIQQAAKLAQPGDTVFIRGGIYRETVIPAHSGTAAAPIVYQPYNGEQVTIDGADPLAGWSVYKNAIYQANFPWDLGDGQNQVFVDGQMINEARWPNVATDVAHPARASVSSVAAQVNAVSLSIATIGVTLSDPIGTWVGATIHIAPGQGWVTQTGTVIASAPGTLTYTYQQLTPYEVPSAGNPYYLTGLFRMLDAPGEWYRDSSGNLYVWAPQGANPTTHVVEAKRRQYAFDLSGISNVRIAGLNLFACTINTDAASSNDVIDGIAGRYVSHNMAIPDPWFDQDHPHTTGIILSGGGDVLENSTIDFSSGDGAFIGGSDDTVQNCTFSNIDYAAGEEAGVFVLGTNATVLGNTIYNCGRSGIVYRKYPGAMISHNLIHDVGLQDTDLGGIYTYGTDGGGAEISYNLVYNVHSGGYGAAGIYLDNGSAHFVVDHNVTWNCDFGLKMNPPCASDMIYNNTLGATQYSVASSGSEDMTGSVLANNLFTVAVQIGPNATQSHNLFQITNPAFVNASANNYQLAANSPAIDAGMIVSPYTDGYIGKAPDQGAYERGLPAFAAGSAAPGQPTRVVAGGAGNAVVLRWGANPSTTSFTIYRGASAGGEGATPIVAGIMGNSFTDAGLSAGQTYYYQVIATSAVGQSARSVEVSAPALLPGDITGDGTVSFADLLVLTQNFGRAPAAWSQGDLNGDGSVGFADLMILARSYATGANFVSARPAVAPAVAGVTSVTPDLRRHRRSSSSGARRSSHRARPAGVRLTSP